MRKGNVRVSYFRSNSMKFMVILFAAAAVSIPVPAFAERGFFSSSDRDKKPFEVKSVSCTADLKEDCLLLEMVLQGAVSSSGCDIPLLSGDAALASAPEKGAEIRHSPETGFVLRLEKRGKEQTLKFTFILPAKKEPGGSWRQVSAGISPALDRFVSVGAPDANTEVELLGCVEVARKDGKVSGRILPQAALSIRWKPQLSELESSLVFSAEGHSIATLEPAILRLDSLFCFSVSQGKMRDIRLSLPKELHVTAVSGPDIAQWQLSGNASSPELVIELARPCENTYALNVQAEQALPALPATITVPVVTPRGCMRYGGHLSVGTDSALSLGFPATEGLTQMDEADFPQMSLSSGAVRRTPARAGFYRHASDRYNVNLSVRNMEPVVDASFLETVQLSDDNLMLYCDAQIEVRDAALPQLEFIFDAGLTFSSAQGTLVESDDAMVRPVQGRPEKKSLVLTLKNPLLGKGRVRLAFELGKSPLLGPVIISHPELLGSRGLEGYVQMATEKGLELKDLKSEELRETPLSSLPSASPDACLAWRFREKPWTISFAVGKKDSNIHCEAFHLLSLGEAVAYGSAAVNYFITDASIDSLRFRVPPELENLDFVSVDVRFWKKEGDLYTVQLKRKILGEYNLAVTWRQKYKDGGELSLGGVSCEGVDSETGYLVISSALSLRLEEKPAKEGSLIRIAAEELPSHYMLMVSAPVLSCHKYIDSPHGLLVSASLYKAEQPLSALVELCEMNTSVGLDPQGRCEAVSRAKYMIKNSGEQYLPLKMPKHASIWSASIRAGAAQEEKVTPSRDGETVKLPLPRLRNPNEPLSVTLEYGQILEPSMRGSCVVEAPLSGLKTSFASWTIETSGPWAVLPASGGSMALTEGESGSLFARTFGVAADSWAMMLRDGPLRPALAILFWACAASLLMFFRRGRVRQTVSGAFLGIFATLAAMAGLKLGDAGAADISAPTRLRFEQALSLSPDIPLSMAISVVPAWRAYLSVLGCVAVVLIVAFVFFRALRGGRFGVLSAGILLAALLYGAAFFQAGAVVLVHALTWGAPVAASALCLFRLLPPCGVKAASVAAAFVLAFFVLGTSARAQEPAGRGQVQANAASGTEFVVQEAPQMRKIRTSKPPVSPVALRSLECIVNVEKDCARLEEKIELDSPGGLEIKLLSYPAVLVSFQAKERGVEIKEKDGIYLLKAGRRGRLSLSVNFLIPLSATKDRSGSMRVFLPEAMEKKVKVILPGSGLFCAIEGGLDLVRSDEQERVTTSAALRPDAELSLAWEPRHRTASLEKPVFSAVGNSVWYFEPGAVEGYHLIALSISRGELPRLELLIPEGCALSAVDSSFVSAWRFDPASRRAELQFATPLSGTVELLLRTQSATGRAPYRFVMAPIRVVSAEREQASSGVESAPEIAVATAADAGWMDAQDFRRAAGPLFELYEKLEDSELKKAFRHKDSAPELTADTEQVTPEIRISENASLSVSSERMVYNTELDITVSKAGIFDAALAIPRDWYTEALSCPDISHWEEENNGGLRVISLHFNRKLLGATKVSLTLSQAGSERLSSVGVPSLSVRNALRHSGELSVSSEKGIRLFVADKDGVSELRDELPSRGAGADSAMRFKMLKAERRLTLSAEVLDPRIEVSGLHVARIKEGSVLHEHWLRYGVQNAGVKEFCLVVPTSSMGLVVDGPDIASVTGPLADGLVRVELSRKCFDREYPLSVRYEQRFDKEKGLMEIAPLRPGQANAYKGWVCVMGTERVEVSPAEVPPEFLPADPRSIPSIFSAGSLSDSVFCYATSSDSAVMRFAAKRHDLAEPLLADVDSATLTTVLSEQGGTLNRLRLSVRARGKRHLAVTLPEGASFWSLLVSGRPVNPSVAQEKGAARRFLVPLDWTPSGEARCEIELSYIIGGTKLPALKFEGPRFDLPLKELNWIFHCPEQYRYHGFDGTLELDYALVPAMQGYGMSDYEGQVREEQDGQLKKAQEMQKMGSELANKGRQYEARQALQNAFNYSQGDIALNEDNRVQLQDLVKQQAVVGLFNARGELRARSTGKAEAQALPADRFSQEQARRLQSSLGAEDNGNLELIGGKIVEMQQAAAAGGSQISVTLPARGVELSFRRPLQVETDTPMELSFRRSAAFAWKGDWLTLPALALFLALLFALAGGCRRKAE